jgi:hypothetical protein
LNLKLRALLTDPAHNGQSLDIAATLTDSEAEYKANVFFDVIIYTYTCIIKNMMTSLNSKFTQEIFKRVSTS